MSVYLVALTQPNEQVLERVEELWGGRHFQITNTLILVSPSTSSPGAMAQQIGISVDEGKASGIVIEMPENIAGALPSTAVDWYQNARES